MSMPPNDDQPLGYGPPDNRPNDPHQVYGEPSNQPYGQPHGFSQSHGQPFQQDPNFKEPPPHQNAGGPSQAPKQPWFKKKRFVIPLGIVVLLVLVATLTPDPGEETVAAPVTTSAIATPIQSSEATKLTADELEAERVGAEKEAAAKAEADKVAADKAAADKVESDRIAAEKAAADKAEADRVAAEQEAADKAAAEKLGTVSQQNSLRSAESYLDYAAFSRSGLIKQLEFEDFSTEDATWAVDRVTVDWNEQAALKAKSYLDYSAFSRSGLITQLKFEGFTDEEAEYGVSQTGL